LELFSFCSKGFEYLQRFSQSIYIMSAMVAMNTTTGGTNGSTSSTGKYYAAKIGELQEVRLEKRRKSCGAGWNI
jgi:hypothetical protein